MSSDLACSSVTVDAVAAHVVLGLHSAIHQEVLEMPSAIRTGLFALATASLALTSTAGADKKPDWSPCKADSARLCPGLNPGSDEFIGCIRSNREQLSPACEETVANFRAAREAKQKKAATPPAAPQP